MILNFSRLPADIDIVPYWGFGNQVRTFSASSIVSIFLKKIRAHRAVKSFPVRSVIGFGREIIASFIPFRTMCLPFGLSKSATVAMSIDR